LNVAKKENAIELCNRLSGFKKKTQRTSKQIISQNTYKNRLFRHVQAIAKKILKILNAQSIPFLKDFNRLYKNY